MTKTLSPGCVSPSGCTCYYTHLPHPVQIVKITGRCIGCHARWKGEMKSNGKRRIGLFRCSPSLTHYKFSNNARYWITVATRFHYSAYHPSPIFTIRFQLMQMCKPIMFLGWSPPLSHSRMFLHCRWCLAVAIWNESLFRHTLSLFQNVDYRMIISQFSGCFAQNLWLVWQCPPVYPLIRRPIIITFK